tara:strand:+ start:83 stop:658 length:576 start_codon:yes stop_codon:yes gene_type:complete
MATRRPIQDQTKKALPSSQPSNRNFLIPNSFQFSIERTPTVGFFGSIINVPGMTLGVVNQSNYLKTISRPGEILDFSDLELTFFVDEDLQNYLEIDKWMRGLGFPESLEQIYNLQNEGVGTVGLDVYSDATLVINNNQQEPAFKVKFKDMFPYYLSPLEFNSQVGDVEYLQARVGFKYLIYNITPGGGPCC